jgi:hypothetical protein
MLMSLEIGPLTQGGYKQAANPVEGTWYKRRFATMALALKAGGTARRYCSTISLSRDHEFISLKDP